VDTRSCVICGAPSEASIPQGRVCRPHAIEFYVELVKFAIDRDREIVTAPADWQAGPSPIVPRVPRPYVKRAPRWFKTDPKARAA
jgi:hypothetical protein